MDNKQVMDETKMYDLNVQLTQDVVSSISYLQGNLIDDNALNEGIIYLKANLRKISEYIFDLESIYTSEIEPNQFDKAQRYDMLKTIQEVSGLLDSFKAKR